MFLSFLLYLKNIANATPTPTKLHKPTTVGLIGADTAFSPVSGSNRTGNAGVGVGGAGVGGTLTLGGEDVVELESSSSSLLFLDLLVLGVGEGLGAGAGTKTWAWATLRGPPSKSRVA